VKPYEFMLREPHAESSALVCIHLLQCLYPLHCTITGEFLSSHTHMRALRQAFPLNRGDLCALITGFSWTLH